MMSFPFLFLALSLTAGILFSSLFSPSLPLSVFLVTVSLGMAWIFFFIRKFRGAFVFVLLTTLFFGSALHRLNTIHFENNSLLQFTASSYVDFHGTLYKSVSPGVDSDRYFLKVDKLIHQGEEHKVMGRLQVTVARSMPSSNPLHLFVGDRVKISAQPSSLKGYRNFNSSLVERLQKSQRIHNRAYAKSPLLVEKISTGPNFSLLRQMARIRYGLLHKIEQFFSADGEKGLSPQGAVLEALLVGERGRMDEDITRSLQNTGLYHLFAISGAHIALLSFMLFTFLRFLRIPDRLSCIILIFVLVFYAFLVEGRPSILRATIMTLVFLFGKLIWRETNLLNTISISAFALLCANPFHLFDAGFQLTFAATLSIVLFLPKIIKFLPKLPLRISEIFAISLAAQLGVLPIMARTFNRVTFSSLILNFAALPLVALILVCGYIFVPLAFLSSFLASHIAQAINFLIDTLLSLSHLFETLPFLSFRVPTPHLLTAVFYFLFLFSLLIPLKSSKQKGLLFTGFLLIFIILVTYPFSPAVKNLKVTFIDVGQGESILLEFPGRKKMLIDGGGLPTGRFDIGESVVSPFLWKRGIRSIDYMVLTHAHPDHLNGLVSVARNFRVHEFWESLSPVDNPNYNRLNKILSRDTRSLRMFRNDSRVIDGTKIEIVHPDRKEPHVGQVHNDFSMVFRLSYGQTSFLFSGDIGTQAETEILAVFGEIRSDILKSPHHGSDSSSSPEFLDGVRPKIVVISVGERNRYNFPAPEVLLRYEEAGVSVYRTDKHGAIEISSDGLNISVKTAVVDR